MHRLLRAVITGLTVGAVGLGSAWAGSALLDPPLSRDDPHAALPGGEVTDRQSAPEAAVDTPATSSDDAKGHSGRQLPNGWFLAGAATRSLVPPADRWVQGEACQGQAPEQLYTPLTPEGCLITFDMRWADGVDEENPITVRAAAFSNGRETVVHAVMDVVGYMASYPTDVCTDCGIAQMAAALEEDLGIPAANILISSSHTHAAPTTIANGPTWYYEHVRDQTMSAVTEAVARLEQSPPVRLETGVTRAKAFNVDRRIVERAVPDYELGWLRAFVPGKPDEPGRTVVTIANFAVHPTVRNNNAELHSGLLGPFTRRVEEALGGTALFAPGAIGDQTPDKSFGINGLGIGLADRLLAGIERGGTVLQSNDLEVARTEVRIPVENQLFYGLLASGYAVRDFTPPHGGGPLAVAPRANSGRTPVCEGAGETHVVTPITAIRYGQRPPTGKVDVGEEHKVPVKTDNLVVVTAPGEIFASIGVIVKDYLSRSDNVLVTGLTNDTLGYMIPANQYDPSGSQGLGLANNVTDLGNYEEALSLGRCTGEVVMNGMLEVGRQLGLMGEGEGI